MDPIDMFETLQVGYGISVSQAVDAMLDASKDGKSDITTKKGILRVEALYGTKWGKPYVTYQAYYI